jgi:MFS family permease
MLFALRLLLGIGESVAYPSYSKIIALNFPEEHRGLANSVISAGLVLGPQNMHTGRWLRWQLTAASRTLACL